MIVKMIFYLKNNQKLEKDFEVENKTKLDDFVESIKSVFSSGNFASLREEGYTFFVKPSQVVAIEIITISREELEVKPKQDEIILS